MKLLNISARGKTVYLFTRNDKGILQINKDTSFYPIFYEPSQDGKFISYDGVPLKKVFANEPKEVNTMRSLGSYSSDIPFVKNYLINKVDKIDKSIIKYFFIDIEVLAKDISSIEKANCPISCVSIYNSEDREIKTWWLKDWLGLNDDSRENMLEAEKDMLNDFCKYVRKESPDLLLAWNIDFDYTYLHNRIKQFAKKISPINEGRRGNEEKIFYPSGISIIDYLQLFKKVFMREASYALDYIAQKHLKDTSWGESDFSKLTDDIRDKNINDINRMKKLEEMYHIIDYFDEIRRMTKAQWEDLYYNCIDDKSEILTNNGWKNINNISEKDLALSLNIFNNNYEFVPIEKIHKYDYNGDLVYYEHRRINFAVTPNHKFPMVLKRNGGTWSNKEKIIDFEYADSIPKERRGFILGSNGYKNGKTDYFSDEEIELCGWIITEGHFEKKRKFKNQTGNFGGGIYIYQSLKNIDNRNRIKKLLDKLNIPFTEGKISFRIPVSHSTRWRVLLNEEKRIPKIFFDLPLNQIRLLIEILTLGDGHFYNLTGYISTKDKELAEQYQILCILAGYNAYITTSFKEAGFFILGKKVKKDCSMYTVTYFKEDFYITTYHDKWKRKQKYEGKIWCISTIFHNFVMRRNSKVIVSGNSRIVEMLLFEEAKLKDIILPNKKEFSGEDTTFQGATRNSEKDGIYFDIGKFDLTSAYPSMIVNFCLDTQNIPSEIDSKAININGNWFRQNKEALLPSVVRKILVLKDNLKKERKKNPSKENKIKYDAIKAIVNSTFGVMGNKYFRLYDNRIASTITFLVRDLLMYVKKRIEDKGLKVIYWDTDSVFITTKEDISNELNIYVQDWAKSYGKESIDLSFEYEGYFTKLFLLGKCHYYGYINGEKEIKGVEIKRNSSSKYEAYFQEELINKVLNKVSQEEILAWIASEKERIKTLPLKEIAFPCKLTNKEYKNEPIFKRAFNNTQILNPNFKSTVGEIFYYIYTKNMGYDKSNVPINVLAIKEDTKLEVNNIDYEELIRRNILTKADAVFEAMEWNKMGLFNNNQYTLF
jgi:DNA polymerase elongation subunit (family B)